jgi:hypothetical protein
MLSLIVAAALASAVSAGAYESEVRVFVLYVNTAPDGVTDLRVHETTARSLPVARAYLARVFVQGLETVQNDIPPVRDGASDCCATVVVIAPGQLRKAWIRPTE